MASNRSEVTQRFTPFQRLPVDIRYMIWEAAVTEPGIHWVRLHTAAPAMHPPKRVALAPIDVNDGECDALPIFSQEIIPQTLWPATLEPRYPTPQANLSSYRYLSQTMRILSATCRESLGVMRRFANLPGVLKLEDGRVISLRARDDVVCLEYATSNLYKRGNHLDLPICCSELGNIRQVAMHYCHEWDSTTATLDCPICGGVHAVSNFRTHPVHLYQFLARHLPNLQEFYFIDYLIQRKPHQTPSTDRCADKTAREAREVNPQIYKTHGRVFVGVDPDDWTIRSGVLDTLSWLRRRFVQYATGSRLSTHKTPTAVKFGVLACEWVNNREHSMIPRNKRRRRISRSEDRIRAKIQSQCAVGAVAPQPSPASYVFGHNLKFKFGFSSDLSNDM